jgi:imidazolonepropionase
MENGTKTLDAMLEHGTTTVEAKSGYGLSTKDELKMLEVVKRLNQLHSMDIVPTFLAAHAIPPEFSNNVQGYVNLVTEEMMPKVAEKGLAEFCDVFCEKGVFGLEQTRRILSTGKSLGLKPKVHADEMSHLGGAELAADIGAVSADHLLFSSKEGIEAMAEKGVAAVLLPASAFSLMTNRYADARGMIDYGVPVALGTDFNPNCWVESQQFVVGLACHCMKMTPAEAITATTINAAHVVNRASEVGSLEVGKRADVIILDVPNHKFLGYRFDVNLVEKVIKNGRIVVDKEASREEFRLLEEQEM